MLPNITVIEVIVILLNLPFFENLLFLFYFICHTIITKNIGKEENKKWWGDLTETIENNTHCTVMYFSRDVSKHPLAAILTGWKRAYHWLKLLQKTKLGDVLKGQVTEKPCFPLATTLLQFEIYL